MTTRDTRRQELGAMLLTRRPNVKSKMTGLSQDHEVKANRSFTPQAKMKLNFIWKGHVSPLQIANQFQVEDSLTKWNVVVTPTWCLTNIINWSSLSFWEKYDVAPPMKLFQVLEIKLHVYFKLYCRLKVPYPFSF